jgi:hypothetical protein
MKVPRNRAKIKIRSAHSLRRIGFMCRFSKAVVLKIVTWSFMCHGAADHTIESGQVKWEQFKP